MIRLVVIFALCVIGVLTAPNMDEMSGQIKEFANACFKEIDITEEAIHEAYKNGNLDEGNEKLTCFVECFLKKMGIMDANGNIEEDVSKMIIPPEFTSEEVKAIIPKCKDVTGDNSCIKAMHFMKCLKENGLTV